MDEALDRQVRGALAELVLAIDELVAINRRLTTKTNELVLKLERAQRQEKLSNERADDFAARMEETELRLTRKAQEAEQRASEWEQRAKEASKSLLSDIEGLRRTLQSAEERAMLYEATAEELAKKANRTDALEAACEKLLTVMERLPLRMEDAGLLQTVVKPEIPLYGTHEWRAVMDAKLGLVQVMGEAWPGKEN